MARSPFQGTWQQGIRPTIVTSPDAVVYLNGEVDILGCPKCRRRFNWNKYITNIQVDLSIDSVPGSASFSLSIPRHSVDQFYFDGIPLISPMMEVEIFAKGYFLVEGLPQYYPIFWGIVTEVSDSYSSGEHTVSVNCADILKWWELCKMNINPAFTQSVGQQGRNIFGNVFSGTNPYDIIWSLAQHSFGDVVIGSGSLLSMYKEANQRPQFNAAMADIMMYWEQRFGKIRSNLLLYGTRGNAVRGDLIMATVDTTSDSNVFNPDNPQRQAISQVVRRANGGDAGLQMVFDPTDPQVTAFRIQFMNAGQVNFWQSEFQTKLELANAAKECIGFEFFMDVDGSIVFKPPFYNLDIISNKPTSWIQDVDVIDWDLSESEAEVVTQLQIQGSFGGNTDYGFGEEMTPATSVTDYHLLRKYGWRVETFNSEFMGSTLNMFYLGLDMLDRMNARRHRGTVNIPLRPELRLGFPVYLAPKDQIWYVAGISHNIQFGGRAQTTLTLTAKRSKFIAPKGIGTIKLSSYNKAPFKSGSALKSNLPSSVELSKGGMFSADVGEAAQIPPTNYPEKPGDADPYEPLILRHPKTGRLVGYPNVVMAYTRPFAVPDKDFKKVSGQRSGARNPSVVKELNEIGTSQAQEFAKWYQSTGKDAARERYLSNRFQYGLNSAGVFVYLYDTTAVIKELLLTKKGNIQFAKDDNDPVQGGKNATAMIRPVSDERGFEVIGHYKYGRNVSLRDGSLVLNETDKNPEATNSKAQVRSQVAIAGGLYETLTAQSQGLVDLTLGGTTKANPSHAIATLAPDGTDLQTAGVVNPETGKPEFVETGENYVDVAPLGSPQQKGAFTNVEASQLSRALTLAEMSVLNSNIDSETCGCLMNRSDLSFINIGYRVKVLNTTTGENNSAIAYGEDPAVKTQQDAIYAIVKAAEDEARTMATADPMSAYETPEQTKKRIDDSVAAARQKTLEIQSLQSGISENQLSQLATEGQTNANSPTPITAPVLQSSMTREEALSKVESFLVSLYQALDTPHQEHEKVLRGDYIQSPVVTTQEVRFGRGFNPQDQGGFAPPFSSPDRAFGGDPKALAQQGDSARQDLEKSWNKYGSDLEANLERTKLEGEIGQLKKKASELQARLQEWEKMSKGEGLIVTNNNAMSPSEIQAELDKTLQELQNKQQKLDTLNQEHPS